MTSKAPDQLAADPLENLAKPLDAQSVEKGVIEAEPATDPQYQEYLENRDAFLKYLAEKKIRKEDQGFQEYPKWVATDDGGYEVKDADDERVQAKAHKAKK